MKALSPQKYLGNVVTIDEANTDQCDRHSFSCNKLIKMLWTSDSYYGSYMMSANGKYTAEFQGDCNLVIYVNLNLFNIESNAFIQLLC